MSQNINQFKKIFSLNKTMYTCKFCNSTFELMKNLNRHQKSAKYCINQQKSCIKYACEFCSNTFSNIQLLNKHQKRAKFCLKLQNKQDTPEILELKQEIELLKQQIKPNSINTVNNIDTVNNNINNINNIGTMNNNVVMNFFLDPNTVKNIINTKLDDTHLRNSIPGIVEFVKRYILTQDNILKYVCKDYSRKIFAFNDENNNEIRDFDAKHLISLLRQNLKNRVTQIVQFLQDKVDNLENSQKYRVLHIEEEKQLLYIKSITADVINTGLKIMDMDTDPEFKVELSKVTSC